MPSKQTLLIIGLVTFLALVGLYSVPFQDSSPKALPHPVKRGIMHIVMFEFKDETTEEQRIDVRRTPFFSPRLSYPRALQ